MKATELMNYYGINAVDEKRVKEIKESILENGWVGAPILVCESLVCLITGSHRLAALKAIYENDWDVDLDSLGDVAEDVTDIIEAWCIENDATIDDVPYNNLSAVFAGTWVEQYADEIEEW